MKHNVCNLLRPFRCQVKHVHLNAFMIDPRLQSSSSRELDSIPFAPICICCLLCRDAFLQGSMGTKQISGA
eukprot:165004-Pelagomonas_calceolata.AAC.4